MDCVADLARAGQRKIAVIAPAFSADCIETLEEINEEIRDSFIHAGGTDFTYIPCLNAQKSHIDVLCDIIQTELAGWGVRTYNQSRKTAIRGASAGNIW